MNQKIQYEVSQGVHTSLVDLFSRLDMSTLKRVLSTPRNGVKYTEMECEIKTELLFQFYYNELLVQEQKIQATRA